MKSCVAGLVAMIACASAGGSFTFVATDANADWSDPNNYRTESSAVPAVVPGSCDTVTVQNCEYKIAVPSASFNAIKGFNRIIPVTGSKFVFDVTDTANEYTNSCAMTAGLGSTDYKKGEIVKKGPGTLVLAADGVVVNKTAFYDYYLGLTVVEGALKLPQYSSAQTAYYGCTSVSNGATLFTTSQKPGGSTALTLLRTLSGDGILTNTVTKGSTRSGHSMATAGNGSEASVFSGIIATPITLYQQTGTGQLTLLGTNSNFSNTYFGYSSSIYSYPESDYGVISFLTIGDVNGKSSSLGGPGKEMLTSVNSLNAKGVLRYLGTGGETCSRKFSLGTQGVVWFDAGAHGGITFTGNWEAWCQQGNVFYRLRRLNLAGSNETACVIKGNLAPFVIPSPPAAANSVGYIANTSGYDCVSFPIYVTKRGTGVWRFAKGAASTATGGMAIEQGTLQFETIAEKGKACSLGLATQTTACDPNALLTNSATYVDYAYTLGNPANAADRPVFEYVGTTNAICTTRPIALVGGGGELRSSSTNPAMGLTFEGVSPRDANATCTFVLGGTNTSERNVVSGISDGAGKVNLLKTGRGRWTLTGDNPFTGSLHVADGTLELRGPRYTWFRFTIKEVAGWTTSQARGDNTYGPSYGLTIGEVALYDKDGVRRNVGLTQPFDPATYPLWGAKYGRDYREMSEGQAEWDTYAGYFFNGSVMGSTVDVYDTSKYYRTFNRRLDVLFEGAATTDGWFYFAYPGQDLPGTGDARVAEQRQPKLSEPDSWLSLVMRLPDDTPEIRSYDLSSGLAAQSNRWPLKFSLEGSVDGRSWTMLDNHINYDADALTNGHEHCWYSDLQPVGSSETRTGFPINGAAPSANLATAHASSISVGANGTLVGSHGSTLSSLAVDVADAGTIQGFAFAAEGTLDVTGTVGPGGAELPMTFTDVEGLDNLSRWTLTVNGRSNYSAKVSGGRVTIFRKGFAVIFR